ncbi:MAG TPA: M15 family metallopeptidase [Gaiellaceae bacterium]|nr:M15 family metallopeptidase [Gaiellaceae bacterium]
MRVVLLLAAAAVFVGTAEAPPRFVGAVSKVTAADLPYSWRPGCPVSPSQLRRLTVSHWDLAGRRRVGSIVVRASAARAVISVFRKLYAAHFPIRRLRLVEAYKGSDDASMAADNTSGFNCRFVSGTRRWSQHAYGLAIDINPVENPFIHGGRVEPPAGHRYLDRSRARPGMVVSGDVVVRAFAAIGWSWGGHWASSKDYQHFSAKGT